MMNSMRLGGLAVVLFALSACPVGGRPGGLPGGGGATVDPDSCAITGSDIGRKLHAFLEATVVLDAQVTDLANTVRSTCVAMGQELAMSADALKGDTNKVCQAVADNLKEGLSVGLKAEAKFEVIYQPAVCTVNIDAAASASAECEASASGSATVRCQGTCEGTCTGACSGTCAAKNADGSCAGRCDGECGGSCSGSCSGAAEVEGSAECKAAAEVKANIEASCTEPTLDIRYDAAMVVDASRIDQVKNAITKGLPRLFMVKAKLEGPVKFAFTTWAKTASDLKNSASDIAGAFKDQAMCVTGQIGAAFAAMARIEVNISVSVEASASVGGAAGAQAGG